MNSVSRLSQLRLGELRSALRRLAIGHLWKRCQMDHRRRWPDDIGSVPKNAKVDHNTRRLR